MNIYSSRESAILNKHSALILIQNRTKVPLSWQMHDYCTTIQLRFFLGGGGCQCRIRYISVTWISTKFSAPFRINKNIC